MNFNLVFIIAAYHIFPQVRIKNLERQQKQENQVLLEENAQLFASLLFLKGKSVSWQFDRILW